MFGLLKKKNDPVRDILLSKSATTPDEFWLQQRANWLVFMYCDKQLGHPSATDQADMVWWGFTRHPCTMWKNELGKLSHPVVLEQDERLKDVLHNRVRGQVVRMRTDRLIQLDVERRNGVQFKRKRVPIVIPHTIMKRDHKLHSGVDRPYDYQVPSETTIYAWMYVGVPDYWIDQTPKISKININRDDGRKSTEYLLRCGQKVVPSVTRYLPNNNAEPYYYYSPTEQQVS